MKFLKRYSKFLRRRQKLNSIQSFTEKHIILQFKISKIKESSHRKYQIPKFIVHRFLLSARKLLLPSIIPPFFNLQHSFSTILSNESFSSTLLKRARDEPFQQQAGKNPRRRRKERQRLVSGGRSQRPVYAALITRFA